MADTSNQAGTQNQAAGNVSVTQNAVTLPDGTTHVFPPDATPEEMQAAISQQQKPKQPLGPTYSFSPVMGSNIDIDAIRPLLATVAGHFAGAGAGAISGPAAPITAPMADVAGYAATDYLLKKLNPNTWAVKQQGGDQAIDSIRDGLINAVGGRILNGVFRGVQAFRNANLPEIYKFAPTTSQALESLGYHTLATGAKFAEDFGATGAKAAALDKAGGAGFTQALSFANQLNGRMASTNIDPVKIADKLRATLEDGLEPAVKPQNYKSWSQSYKQGPMNNPMPTPTQEAVNILNGGSNPFSKLDQVIQDPDRLSKVLTAGQTLGPSGLNVRRDLQAYQFMRMINDGTTRDAATGAVRLDPNKIAQVWNDPDLQNSLNTLYGKQGRQDVSDFIKNIAYTQDKMQAYPIAKQLRFLGSGFALAGSLLTGNLTAAGATAGSLATAYIPTAVMGKLLTTEGVSKYVGQLASGAPLSTSAKAAGRAIVSALQGYNIAMMDAQGNKTWGHVEKDKSGSDWSFVPLK